MGGTITPALKQGCFDGLTFGRKRCRRWRLWSVIEKTGLVFQTRCGNSWSSDTPSSAISGEFRKLAIKVGVKRTFYDLRRTFQTVGDDKP